MPSERKSQPDTPESKPARKPGRPPTPVPQHLAEEAIAWLEQGKTLAEWCRLPGKVERSTVHRWMEKDEAFAQRLARARDKGMEVMLEQCGELADTKPEDNVEVQWRKLQIETRLKLLAIYNPKKYGPKAHLDHGGNVSIEVITGVPDRDPEA